MNLCFPLLLHILNLSNTNQIASVNFERILTEN